MTIWCFIICFGTNQAPVQGAVLDTYCSNYVQVVQSAEEAKLVLGLPKAVRSRLQGNELEYHCRCKGLKDEACRP